MNTLLIISACLSVTLALPNGPPMSACSNMIPSHGTPTVTGEPPYVVTVDTVTFSKGSSLKVTVMTTNGTTFRGFFVQARVNDDDFDTNEALGMFSDFPTSTSGIDCFDNANSAWGHTVNTDKTSVEATWTYDGECEDIGDIAFRVSVVQGNPATRYYTDIVSESLMFDMDMCSSGAGYIVSSILTIIAGIIIAVL